MNIYLNKKRITICSNWRRDIALLYQVIKSFKCSETEKIFNGQFSRKYPDDIQRISARKLEMLHAATRLESLKRPPNNRLEKLKRERTGQHSIRINKQ